MYACVIMFADVLGGLRPSPVFIDEFGQSVLNAHNASSGVGTIYVIDNGAGGVQSSLNHYNKTTTWIVTPKVR